ncbi:MAG: hypothetical protein H8D23_10975 [Candidatus Brocadiales bacterium]|nr:hypothetical protein [Candidatus Brocadiales bacterium]
MVSKKEDSKLYRSLAKELVGPDLWSLYMNLPLTDIITANAIKDIAGEEDERWLKEFDKQINLEK